MEFGSDDDDDDGDDDDSGDEVLINFILTFRCNTRVHFHTFL